MHPHFRGRQSGEGAARPAAGRARVNRAEAPLARPAAEGEDTGGGGAGDVGRRLPVDARSPGCRADLIHGKVFRAGVSGAKGPSIPRHGRTTFAIAYGDLTAGLFLVGPSVTHRGTVCLNQGLKNVLRESYFLRTL
jgi:hypothetical protein